MSPKSFATLLFNSDSYLMNSVLWLWFLIAIKSRNKKIRFSIVALMSNSAGYTIFKGGTFLAWAVLSPVQSISWIFAGSFPLIKRWHVMATFTGRHLGILSINQPPNKCARSLNVPLEAYRGPIRGCLWDGIIQICLFPYAPSLPNRSHLNLMVQLDVRCLHYFSQVGVKSIKITL